MLEKFLLAVTITFCLKLLLGVGFGSPNPSTSRYQLVETPTPLLRLLFSDQPQQYLPSSRGDD